MAKRKHAAADETADDVISVDNVSIATSSSQHSRYRMHVHHEAGPLYIANFATRFAFGISSNSNASHGPIVKNPHVLVEKKPSRSHGLGASFRLKTNDANNLGLAMVTSKLMESSKGKFQEVEVSGTTAAISEVESHRKLYVAFVNKQTRKVNVIPARSVVMRPELAGSDNEEAAQEVPVVSTPEANRQSVQDLTFAFGSHRKQKALSSALERKSLASDAVNAAIETALQEAKTAPVTPSSDKTNSNDSSAMEDTSPSSPDEFDIGVANIKAVASAEVFPLSQLISEEHLASLEPVSREKESELPVLVRKCFSGSLKPSDSLMQLLTYLRVLIEMHKARGAKIKRGDVVPRWLPYELKTALTSRFLVALESTGDSTTWSMPPRLRTRLLVHIILIAMHAYSQSGNSFAVNVSDLQADLALAPRTLLSVARQVGCTVNAANSSSGGLQVITIHIPYKPPPPPVLSRARGGRR